jgi:manganese/zinc/iron transport system permease protein
MYTIEHALIQLLLLFIPQAALNDFLRDPRHVALLIGSLIAIAGALPGTFLLLRRMSLTTDAISHTVLLGIVVAFLFMVGVGQEADLSSPLLILGAAVAGVATVVLTEMIYRSGLVKADAALGLAFPLLFAVAILLVSRFTANIHLDTDAVMVGEIGIAWTDTNSHCLSNCEAITITPEDPRAETRRECTNCQAESISPRSPKAVFSETCANCGTYTPAEAWSAGYLDAEPSLVFFPKSLTVMLVLTLLTIGFVALFYKELKLSTFDPALAASLGLRPGMLHYALMVIVSLVAVGAFNAVGSVLVVAFFIIPAAAAYLLSDRLSVMLALSPVIGALGAYTGYDLSRGDVLGLFNVRTLLQWLDNTVGIGGYTEWNVSISASMVMMLFVLFVLAWILSPKYGLIATMLRRYRQRQRFADVMVLRHIQNHEGTDAADDELAADSLYEHFRWSKTRMQWVLARLRAFNWVDVTQNRVQLTEHGREQLITFAREMAVEL